MDYELLSEIIEGVLRLALPVVVVMVLKIGGRLFADLWFTFRRDNPPIARLLEEAAKFAVRAAEQAGAGELIEDKKAYALNAAEKWLKTQKIDVDLDLIDAAVEKAVLEEFNQPKTAYTSYLTGTNGATLDVRINSDPDEPQG